MVRLLIRSVISASLLSPLVHAEQTATLDDALLFRASFDKSADADIARGDTNIYTATSLDPKKITAGLTSGAATWQPSGGRSGGMLRFHKKSDQVVLYKGGNNLPYRSNEFAGTVSMWMKVDPQQDLPKGYVDPLQITDKKWNDAAFFVDFDRGADVTFGSAPFLIFDFGTPAIADLKTSLNQKGQ